MKSCLGGGLIFLIVVAVILLASSNCGPQESVTVTRWHVGDSYVTGTLQNGSNGCSHLEVDLKAVDHNDSVVNESTITVGDVAAGAKASWAGHFTGLVGNYVDLPASVVNVKASLYCGDQK